MTKKKTIGIFLRENHKSNPGGDIVALKSLAEGLRSSGIPVMATSDFDKIKKNCSFVFVTNLCLDKRNDYEKIQKAKIPYGIISFHEDFLKYSSPSESMVCMAANVRQRPEYKLEYFENNPELATAFKASMHKLGDVDQNLSLSIKMLNNDLVENSELVITSSEYENKTIHRDFTHNNVVASPWAVEYLKDYKSDPSMLEYLGLDPKSYILQVGRLETRKNQIATAFACRDIEEPLVFVATPGYQESYEMHLVETLLHFRKHRTIVLVNKGYRLREGIYGDKRQLEVRHTPEEQSIPRSQLNGLMENASVYCHPAFYELPGLVYLESIKAGTPVVASEWCAIKEYAGYNYKNDDFDGMMKTCLPYDIVAIRDAVLDLKDKKFAKKDFPIFSRTNKDLAKPIVDYLS